jgi:hypothetical protein
MRYSAQGAVAGVSAVPVLIDHAQIAANTLPFPMPEVATHHVRSALLCTVQLTDSALVAELGLPPQQTLAQLMPPTYFDSTAPTFNDVCGALEMLGVGGRLGVQVWAILGAIMHLLLARWVLLRKESGLEGELPRGVMQVQQHISWAARCMQMLREDLSQMLQLQGPSGGQQLQFTVSATSLACLPGTRRPEEGEGHQ